MSLPTDEMDREEAYEIARGAVEALVAARGADARFPPNEVWEYAARSVPQARRSPGPFKRLCREGYLQETGETTLASSEAAQSRKVTEYRPGWRFQRVVQNPEVGDVSVAGLLGTMATSMSAAGFIVEPSDLANFYLALKVSPLLILAGTSGTGKSSLPRLFAERVGAEFVSIPVKPQWSDNSDLFGYTSSLDPTRFVAGEFTRVIERAQRQPDKLFVVLLDEMNLAAVEHYFSDFLSVVETRRKRPDPAGGQPRVVTDSLPLELPVGQNDPYESVRSGGLPPNVRVVGTANVDETTRLFSPKVLDRAMTIEFEEVDLRAFVEPSPDGETPDADFSPLMGRILDPNNPVAVAEVYNTSRDLFDSVASFLDALRARLRPAGLTFGFRPRDTTCLYLWHWQQDALASILAPQLALDFCVHQKVLPKIGGTGEGLRQVLLDLQRWLRTNPLNGELTATGEEGRDPDLRGIASASGTEEEASEEDLVPVEEEDGEAAGDETETTPLPNRPCVRSARKVQRMFLRLRDEGATMYWGA